jgi:hypothetical protein
MHQHYAYYALFFYTIVLSLSIAVSSFSLRPSIVTTTNARRSTRLRSTSNNDNNNNNNNNNDDAATRYREQAERLREQIRAMEEQLGSNRRPPSSDAARTINTNSKSNNVEDESTTNNLKGKRVLVTGANGRLGSMVCRYLLRNYPQTEVVAAVHYVGENSSTARGYGRLAYEVGAEDGVGTIGPAWSAEDRTASFQYSDEMKDYNLKNIRIVEVELLDPIQCNSIMEGVDSVIWCATDFNGNKPRAVSGLNVAFLFRALADPTKGRVEIEGLRNILGSLKQERQSRRWKDQSPETTNNNNKNDPVNVVLVSTAPEAYKDFETPFGTFNGLKREGEKILQEEFPSLTYTVLQMAKFEDNFVEESLDILTDDDDDDANGNVDFAAEKTRRKINRRDAARAAADALIDYDKIGKVVQVYTALR